MISKLSNDILFKFGYSTGSHIFLKYMKQKRGSRKDQYWLQMWLSKERTGASSLPLTDHFSFIASETFFLHFYCRYNYTAGMSPHMRSKGAQCKTRELYLKVSYPGSRTPWIMFLFLTSKGLANITVEMPLHWTRGNALVCTVQELYDYNHQNTVRALELIKMLFLTSTIRKHKKDFKTYHQSQAN